MRKKQIFGIIASCSVLCLIFSSLLLRAQQPQAPNSDFAPALWVARADGLHKIATGDGSTLLQITNLKNIRAITLDEERAVLWAYIQNTLWAYRFNGQPAFAIPLTSPGDNGDGKEVALQANPRDGSVWLGVKKSLYQFGAQGQRLAVHSLPELIQALAWDPTTGCLWVATKKTLAALNNTAGLCQAIDLGAHPDVQDLAVDPANGDLWVAMKKALLRFDPGGTLLLDVDMKTLTSLTSDHQGGVWIAADKSLMRMDRTGLVRLQVEPPEDPDKIIAMVSDPVDSSLWIASKKWVSHLRSDGHFLQHLDFKGEVRALALYADRSPPALAFVAPRHGTTLNTNTPALEFQYRDNGSGIDWETLRLQVNDVGWSMTCRHSTAAASCAPTASLPEGVARLTATIEDVMGNSSEPAETRITIDTIPPVVTLTSPSNGSSTNQSAQRFVGSLSEPAALTLNGQEVQVESTLNFTHGPVVLREGVNRFELMATDAAANSRRLEIQVTLDTVPPVAPDKAMIAIDDAGEGQVRVQAKAGSVAAGSRVSVTNARTGQTVLVLANSEGGFEVTIAAQAGDSLSIVVVDEAGNSSLPSTVDVERALPPDPSSVAPAIDRTVVSDFSAATAFLYSGNPPIQTGLAPGTIEPHRVAVLRGQARTRDGAALAGVTISVLGHAEYGQTLTRADGMFDMAVNGGGVLTLRYEKEHYLPVQRAIQAPWRDYAWLPDVVMIPYDHHVTAINLAESVTAQAAHGSLVTDERGSRRATLLFPPGTQAAMILPDGRRQALTTLHTRATEYTVGTHGKAALPGELPPASGYTYAVELSVDEANAVGAHSVEFTQPVWVYVDNFLGFPVGGAVPSGYYDGSRGLWVASRNGRVVRLVGISAGLADLDTDGDGAADAAPMLASLSITEEERRSLAALYDINQSFWRVPVTHFTPYDFNWPVRLRDGSVLALPPLAAPVSRPVNDPDTQCGSIIACQNQSLGEALSISGTPFHLHYQSDRAPGYSAARTVEISLTDDTATMSKVFLTIEVAGQRILKEFAPAPNLTYTFTWDGLDGYGRELQGEHPVNIAIGYYLDLCYEPPAPVDPSFSLQTTGSSGAGWGIQSCTDSIMWQQQRTSVMGYWDSRAQQLGAWTIDAHHTYDLRGKVLHMGDGTRRSMVPLGQVITTVAGRGSSGSSGDGKPASEAYLRDPYGLAVAADGSIYIADAGNHRIRRIGTDNIITTVVGSGVAGYNGDGGPATAAQLNNPRDVAVGPDGSLYIADSGNYRIRKVSPLGMITTVAGSGPGGFSADGKPATEVYLNTPFALAVGPEGSLYIAEFYGNRVRRVGPEGIMTTVAGTSGGGFGGDGGPATAALLNNPLGLAIAGDGSLYIADTSNRRIRRVGIDGTITTVAGNGSDGHGGDGGPAIQAQLHRVNRIAVGPDGSLYIADSNYGSFDYIRGLYVRRVRPDGIITTVAGSDLWGDGGDGGAATQARFGAIEGVAIGPDSRVYISDNYFMRVRQVGPPLPEYSANDLLLSSGSGNAAYVFDKGGRHLRTVNALTGTVQYQFTYDHAGRLTHISDADGAVTTIERDGAGNPAAIVGPFSQRTTLQLNAAGYLASLTNPAGETTRLTYSAGGLLSTLTDPNGNPHRYTYDGLGRLAKDEDPAGGFKALSIAQSREISTTTVTSALGRSTTYMVERPPSGGMRRVNSNPSGVQSTTEIGTNGTRQITYADGTTTSVSAGPDPRFGTQAPIARTLRFSTPGGLTSIIEEARTATLADPTNLLKLSQAMSTVTVNGRLYTRTFDASSMTLTDRTPMGRQILSRLDGRGRVIEQRVSGLEPLRFTYGPGGELSSVAQGPRQSLFGYDSHGRLATISDPLGHTIGFQYDAVGRVLRHTLPDGREVVLSYDANGNTTSLTPPGRPSHNFTYTSIDLEERYIPPAIGIEPSFTHTTYNLDHQLVEVRRPDDTAIAFGYDGIGRLSTLTFPRGLLTFGYHPSTGNLITITDPDGGMLSYNYDGSLLTGETWSGAISGSVQYSYDNNFRLTAQSLNGTPSVAFQYDADGLLTRAGALAIARHGQTGAITGSTLGNLADTRTYNTFGELSNYKATSSGNDIFTTQYTYDVLGRIVQKTEAAEGQSNAYSYTYDVAGRLTQVRRNGSTVATYTYDANGNRLSYSTPDGTLTATYDDQDRLLHYGSVTYTYTANGELQRKTQGHHTTQYEYDSLGNLRTVTLPSGSRIDYVIDGRNRRVGKKVDGTLLQGFIYDGDLKPAAQLDGSGQISARFIYGTRSNVPDYMIKGGITYRILTDHLGSPRVVIDVMTGHVVQRIAYDVFGQVIFDDNPGFQPFGFAGGLYDPDIRLTRFGARDYDAETGRWTAKDPIRFLGKDANVYGYVLNDPINNIDPQGLLLRGCINAGESYGDAAAQYWADRYNETGNLLYWLPGSLASLWTPETSDKTALILIGAHGLARYLARPFWQYFPAGNGEYLSTWMTRGWGWKPPFATGQQAVEKLALPPYNPATAVKPIKPSEWSYLAGPRRVKPDYSQPGGGWEYRIGGFP